MDSKTPLLTLSVSPTNGNSANDLLARFHPILKELGFGNFEKLESWLYSASKPGESIFRAADVVFAQVDGEVLQINFEGESIFGLASIEKLLKEIQQKYQISIDCKTELLGPNYKSALASSLLYTGLPILVGSIIGIFVVKQFEPEFLNDRPIFTIYILMAFISTRTGFWIKQRKKKRPIWVSSLLLFSVPLIATAVLVLFAFGMNALNS